MTSAKTIVLHFQAMHSSNQNIWRRMQTGDVIEVRLILKEWGWITGRGGGY